MYNAFMIKIIAIVNQKGGSGKTTTAHTLGIGLKKRGYRVLFVDLDGQANLTNVLKIDQRNDGTLALLCKKTNILEVIQKAQDADILAGSEDLFQADMVVVGSGKEYRLKEAIEVVKDDYDYVIVDTPTASGILTINALVASNSVIITSQAEYFNLSGIRRIGEIIDNVKIHRNDTLNISGILLTRFKSNTNLSRDFATAIGELAEKMGTKIFKSAIREAVAVSEAQVKFMSILDYDPNSNVAKDYEAFVVEFLS